MRKENAKAVVFPEKQILKYPVYDYESAAALDMREELSEKYLEGKQRYLA